MGLFGIGGTVGDILEAGASIIPGVGQYLGQRAANQANQQMSERQMEFQQYMSNTAHRREVEDLQAAGLNPILSANRSGASTPSGAMAVAENELEGGGLWTAAKEVSKWKAELAQMKEQTQLTKDQQSATKAQTRKADAESRIIEAGAPAAEVKGRLWETLSNSARDFFNYVDKDLKNPKKVQPVKPPKPVQQHFDIRSKL